jgi:hypothetical protein
MVRDTHSFFKYKSCSYSLSHEIVNSFGCKVTVGSASTYFKWRRSERLSSACSNERP